MSTATLPTGLSSAELVRWTAESLNRQDLRALRQVLTETSVERFPDRTGHGADEIVAYFEAAFVGLPDWSMDPLAIAADGEDVFMRWHLTGTHQGPLLGIEPTGRPLAIDGLDHFVVRDSRIVSNFVIFDQMQYARQIGLMPPDGSAGDKAVKSAFNAKTRVAGMIRNRSA